MILCNVHRMLVFVVSAICLIRCSDGVLDDDQKESIRDYFEDVVECMDIPGLQFSLVQNGVTEMTLAVGQADIENDVAMTTETPMVLASVTKGIFTLTLSKLLHEHPTYTWDTPVREILGDWFYMNNWELTNHMTLKDLVSHRTGMPRQDLIPVYYNWDRLELIKHYRYIEPTEPFRTEYMYANIPYVIAGYIAEVIGERPWEESLQMFFLDPLGMNSTTIWSLDNEDLMDSAAYSYVQVHGERMKVERGSYAQGYQFGAAGYMTSNSEDMAIWTQFLLAGGVTPDDVALIDPVAFAEVFRPETGRSQDPWLSPPNDPFLYTIGDVYAKGFTIGSYRGYKIIQHAGGIPNFNNLQLLFPDIDAGLFISMTIQAYARMYDMSSFVLDTLLGETPYRTAEATCASHAASDPEGFVFDLPEAPAVRDLEDYVGTFGSDAAGNAYVTLENGTLYMKYGRLPGRYEMLSTVAPNVFKGNSTTLESGVFGFIPIGFISSEGDDGVLDVMRIFDQVNFYRDRPLADTSKPLEPLTGECEVCEECEQFNHAATAFSTFSTFSLVVALYVLYLFA